jgi:hypothetical protein
MTVPTTERIPPVEHVDSVSHALRAFLDTHSAFRILLESVVPDDLCLSIPGRVAVQEALARLERLLNPKRLPIGSDRSLLVARWPHEVIAALGVIEQHVYDIIRKWDIPEMCHDGISKRRGKIQELMRAFVLSEDDKTRLEWAHERLVEASSELAKLNNDRSPKVQKRRTPPPPSSRKYTRGKLDEQASIELTKDPSLTCDQLAKMLGCNASTLRNREKCPLLAAAKAKIKAQKREFYGKDKWTDRRADE